MVGDSTSCSKNTFVPLYIATSLVVSDGSPLGYRARPGHIAVDYEELSAGHVDNIRCRTLHGSASHIRTTAT